MNAWHYTTGIKFKLIEESGFLKPATAGVKLPERPCIWFSLDQVFEKTARKAIMHGGILTTLTMRQMFDLGGGLVRFGTPPRRLLSW